MESEVYKLVTNMGNGGLRSYLYSTGCSILYPPNEKVIPIIGKLFAFANIEDAQRAYGKESDGPMAYEIWKAIATGVEKAPSCIPMFTGPERDIDIITQYWTRDLLDHHWPTPQGTVLCDSITLIERMVYAKE